MIERGANHDVIESVRVNAAGTALVTNRYTVIGNGLNYQDASGNWVPSEPIVKVFADGATTLTSGPDAPFGNLVVWLKADSGLAQLGANTPVSIWADQSGNKNHATQLQAPTAGVDPRPLWVPNALNGLPVVQFSGAQLMNLPNCLSSLQEGEVFAVLRVTDFPTSRYYFQTLWMLGANQNSSNERYPFYDGSSYSIYEKFGSRSQNPYPVGIPTQPLNQYHIYEVAAAQNGDWTAWVTVNALPSPQFTTTGNSVGFATSPTLGVTPSGGGQAASFKGDIAEILIFNRVLTDDKKSVVRTYLKNKYGL